MPVEFITPVNVSPSTGSWQDVDVSAYCPAGTTGVILHFKNLSASTTYAVGWRKNGSTDNRTNTCSTNAHWWAAIGVDGNRILEVYIANTNMEVWLVGYFQSESYFFTNAPNKSLSTTDAWTDIDISGDTGGDTAIGAFFETIVSVANYYYNIRNNGSTDDRYTGLYFYRHCAVTIGVDGSEICEGKISNTAVDFFLSGYIKEGAVFNTNATDVSLGSTGSWIDLTALPDDNPVGGIYEANMTTGDLYGMRKNGSSENITGKACNYLPWIMVECDASRLVEGYINDLDVNFYLTGYFTEPLKKTFTADALLKATGFTKAFTADAWVGMSQWDKTFTADAILKATFTKTFEANALLKASGLTKTFSADSLILGPPTIVSPDGGSSETSPVYLRFTTASISSGIKRHFLLQVDKTSSAFGDLELDLDSYTSQTNWEYWDGAAWQSLPAAGLDPAYYGNDVRYQATLTDGNKWWRVREKLRRDS